MVRGLEGALASARWIFSMSHPLSYWPDEYFLNSKLQSALHKAYEKARGCLPNNLQHARPTCATVLTSGWPIVRVRALQHTGIPGHFPSRDHVYAAKERARVRFKCARHKFEGMSRS